MRKIGVLAMQGAFVEHVAALQRLGVEAVPVRLPGELEGLSGLVIPGGESTTIGKLMTEYRLGEELHRLIDKGFAVFGTCAGVILLAKRAFGSDRQSLEAMDIDVRRNAFGRQVDSFEIDIDVPALGQPLFHAVFIRAPWIEKAGNGVQILASLPDGTPVAVREKNLVATCFHPELTTDLRFHSYFLGIVEGSLKPDAAEE
ncbi:MAG: pyridoxal 5'-phosphate synthase glutaminase subunit PdxT [Dehalococcoidia bacterium]